MIPYDIFCDLGISKSIHFSQFLWNGLVRGTADSMKLQHYFPLLSATSGSDIQTMPPLSSVFLVKKMRTKSINHSLRQFRMLQKKRFHPFPCPKADVEIWDVSFQPHRRKYMKEVGKGLQNATNFLPICVLLLLCWEFTCLVQLVNYFLEFSENCFCLQIYSVACWWSWDL